MNNGLKVLFTIVWCHILQSHSLAQSSLDKSAARGKEIYISECIACHMENGEGITGAFPPLAQSDYFENDIWKAVDAIINGLEGELIVNGNTYYGVMDPVALSDEEITDVLNYIRNSWNGEAELLTPEDVTKMKNSGVDQ